MQYFCNWLPDEIRQSFLVVPVADITLEEFGERLKQVGGV